MTNNDLNSYQSITAESSRDWISRRYLRLRRYLRRNHKKSDIPHVFNLLYHAFPDEGKKLIENDGISDVRKVEMLIKWIIFQPQITALVLGDQRTGKDGTLTKIFELVLSYCEENNLPKPRIVTLGNLKKPPFVADEDMYFSFKKIPFGTRQRPVYIYASELEAEFPARDFQSSENKLFSVLEGTLAQNHQKLFGCVKLTAKVDISVLRSCNLKLFKFISPEKLNVEGIERDNLLSALGRWFLPSDITDKAKTLLAFDNNLLTCRFSLPSFWDDDYSEQFRGDSISKEKIFDFVRSKSPDKLTPAEVNKLQIMVYQKFRQEISKSEIEKCLEFVT